MSLRTLMLWAIFKKKTFLFVKPSMHLETLVNPHSKSLEELLSKKMLSSVEHVDFELLHNFIDFELLHGRLFCRPCFSCLGIWPYYKAEIPVNKLTWTWVPFAFFSFTSTSFAAFPTHLWDWGIAESYACDIAYATSYRTRRPRGPVTPTAILTY